MARAGETLENGPSFGGRLGHFPLFLWVEDSVGPARDVVAQLSELGEEPSLPSLAIALRSAQNPEPQGVALVWLDSADGMISESLQPLAEAAANQAGIWLANAARIERLGRSFRQLAEAFAGAIDHKDPRRAGHSGAVAYYSGLIARAMELPEIEVERVEFAALLHDLGRVAVPDAILQKTGALTEDELEAVRQTSATGAQWLAEVDGLESVAAMVRHQNERFDGGGAPDGLSGEEIPLGARILAVATRFSAMTTSRADRGPMSVVGGALEGLANQGGGALDPKVVSAFLRAMGRSL